MGVVCPKCASYMVRQGSGFACPDCGYRIDSEGNPVSGGCFLTTACVSYFGKSDDCGELTTLRKFRDEFLLSFDYGRKIVYEYYSIAPQIVYKLDLSQKKDDIYKYIHAQIERVINKINSENYFESIDIYKKMVKYVEEQIMSEE